MEMRINDNPSPKESSLIIEDLWDIIKEAYISGESQKIGEYKYKNILITIQK